MKKVLLSTFLMAAFAVSKAQTGTVLVGGNVGISTDNNDASQFNFSPFVGYQFNNNWTAGVIADVTNKKSESGGNTYKVNELGVGPFIRYTHTISDIFSIFGQFEGMYTSEKNKINSSTVGKGNGFDLNLYPAVFINVKNGFGLNFDFGGINYNSMKPKGGSSYNEFNLNFGKTVNIGISKNFGGKNKK